MRVAIRFGRLKPLFVLIGITPARSYIQLAEVVRVRMGWAFRADIPRASIRAACRAPDSPFQIGAHGWRHRWVVNGAAGPIVALTINPPARARALLFPLRVRELKLSVDDPDELVAALAADRVASPA